MKPRVIALAALLAACSSHRSGSSSDPLVTGLGVTAVSLFQGLEAPLVVDGAAAPDGRVPIVAGRAGLLRVLVTAEDSWVSHPIVARLELTQAGKALPAMEQTVSPLGTSTQADLTSSINFDLPAETISTDLTWSISLHETAKKLASRGESKAARYPATGEAPIAANVTGNITLTIIPISYEADGSSRLPDTSDAQIARFRDKMMQLYPVTDVQITVGDPISWTRPVSANGSGWDRLLSAIIQKRAQDGVAPTVYYYGLFAPQASFSAYCAQGCVLGLSPLAADPMDDTMRASLGVAYPDMEAESDITFVHEVGHAHGRQHAPCMTPDPDPNYPYTLAELGSWGYNDATKTLLDPSGISRDMMSYCQNQWISDYTYQALYDRVRAVDNSPYRIEIPASWHTLLVARDGSVTRGTSFTARRPPIGTERAITRTMGGTTDTIVGHFYAYDHLAGGMLMIAESDDLGSLSFGGHRVQND
ncbi:MAG: M66 family metalloprotease [Polyangia bacterium]